MYGLATKLKACQGHAQHFAGAAGMPDPKQPFKGYVEEKWDPQTKAWQDMEDCVSMQAQKAGTNVSEAWTAL